LSAFTHSQFNPFNKSPFLQIARRAFWLVWKRFGKDRVRFILIRSYTEWRYDQRLCYMLDYGLMFLNHCVSVCRPCVSQCSTVTYWRQCNCCSQELMYVFAWLYYHSPLSMHIHFSSIMSLLVYSLHQCYIICASL